MCIYYKESLALKVTVFISALFIGDKFCNLISLYRSLSPSANIFENFLDGSEQILENVAFVSVALEDFNVKSMNWYKHDRTSYEETKIEVAPA